MSAPGLLLEMPYVDYDEVEAACADCGRLFRSPEDLESHRQETHPRARATGPVQPRTATLPCSLCSRKFFSIAALKEHTQRDHST
jgi:DNA-directed RNA polymerase subunit RPC12/RpoP